MDMYINDLPEKPNVSVRNLAPTREVPGARGETTLPALNRGGISVLVDKLLCLLDRIIAALTSTGTLRAIRVIVSLVCFFAVVGVIGGIERGALDWRVGALATLAAAAVEVLYIRKCR